jgi:hypothetical protein
MQYYLAASDQNKPIVEGAYFLTFHSVFPKQEAVNYAKQLERKNATKGSKMESSDFRGYLAERSAEAQELLNRLTKWKKDGDYQEGITFLLMKEIIGAYNSDWVNEKTLGVELEARRKMELNHTLTTSDKEVSAQFDFMVGVAEHVNIDFKPRLPVRWGEVNAKLEQSFKGGVWGHGSAKATMEKLGFSAELQAELVIGAELNIDGTCEWKKGNYGLALAGNCNMFLGARGNVSATLSASARKGIQASVDAGAFAGFEASVSGTCDFTYKDKSLANLSASAGITFGVGAEFSASLSTTIFGPTSISCSASYTLGLGTSVSTQTQIDFSQIYLAGREEFMKVVYLPTLLRGYRMDLMTQDRENLHYLEKCIVRLTDEIEELDAAMTSFDKVPMEKRPLLQSMDY